VDWTRAFKNRVLKKARKVSIMTFVRFEALVVGAVVFVMGFSSVADNTMVCVDIVLHDMEKGESKPKEFSTIEKSKDEADQLEAKGKNIQKKLSLEPDAVKTEKTSDDSESTGIAAEVANQKSEEKSISGQKSAAAKLSPSQARVVPVGRQANHSITPKRKTHRKKRRPVKSDAELIRDRIKQQRDEDDRKSIVFLKRLFEYYISHEPGYVANQSKCSQRIRVELYQLKEGWTVFASYSGTGREERVDILLPNELSQFSERAVLALLQDIPISDTINRENVLLADSMKSVQRIRGTSHFMLGLGTQVRGGMLNQAVDEGVEEKIEIFTPITISTGYRGRFENWGLEAVGQVGIGTKKLAAGKNDEGGHIDFGGDAGISLHFLHYFDPRGLTSFYLGAGSTFELLWFSAIKPQEQRNDESRSTLVSAGLDVDGVLGWEFMRASAVQFFLQGELNIPTFVASSEDNYGELDTWFPGLSVKLGIVF
jgi:hypothetical protein